MAKQGRTPKQLRTAQEAQLVGTGDTLAQYSDVFVIASEGETGLCSLYFYQRTLGDRLVVLGDTQTGLAAPKAQCISRILMSAKGIEKLLEGLAENRGFTITRKSQEPN